PIGQKHKFDYAEDNSSYAKIHKKYHPIIRNYLEKFGYYDIFLVDPKTGNIVYSVFKELDFTTSLLDGPYSQTNFGRVFREALNAKDKEFVSLVDFEPYEPSYNMPASFIASPIFYDNEKIGVLIFQVPIDKINLIMTSHKEWEKIGLGKTGECYLIGDDFKMRNDSRFLIETPEKFYKDLELLKIDKTLINNIEKNNSTIGLLQVKNEASEKAISGKTGFEIINDYRGISVLSAYTKLNIPGLNWALMSEIDKSEAYVLSLKLKSAIITLGLIIISLVLALALYFSKTITVPIQQLKTSLIDIAKGNYKNQVKVYSNDEIGVLADVFNNMLNGLNKLVIQATAIASGDLKSPVLNERIEGDLGVAFQKMTQNLKELIRKINDITLEVSSASTETLVISEQIAGRSDEDSNSALARLSATIRIVAEKAKYTEKITDEAVKTSFEGMKSVKNTVEGLYNVSSQTESLAYKLKELSDNSNQIVKIIETISGISEQTNLLALNAAIEAARAGDTGKGFAVVSAEVRKLAERTSASAKEIAIIIEKIQEGMRATLEAMEQSNTSVAKAMNLANRLEGNFNAIQNV
ncbi:MAG TPA: methyl-accepting chemotaxis protein, partial [bacterium]|nr:methyl-accepting chemotaxis protein [bacterium]